MLQLYTAGISTTSSPLPCSPRIALFIICRTARKASCSDQDEKERNSCFPSPLLSKILVRPAPTQTSSRIFETIMFLISSHVPSTSHNHLQHNLINCPQTPKHNEVAKRANHYDNVRQIARKLQCFNCTRLIGCSPQHILSTSQLA